MTEEASKEILLIDKPKGITSYDVIRRLRPLVGAKKVGRFFRPKMGHAGTLDPLASGLMIIGVGEGTKKLNEYLKLPKTYEAEILLGERRTTGDMEGEILESKEVGEINENEIKKTLEGMVGILELSVPIYSAVKRGGTPLYEKARKGKNIEDIPVRKMEVRGFEYHGTRKEGDRTIISVSWNVASGVYIRSLAEELGRRLGYPATIFNLRRTNIGDFSITDAQNI